MTRLHAIGVDGWSLRGSDTGCYNGDVPRSLLPAMRHGFS
jgi:hypothetical protein